MGSFGKILNLDLNTKSLPKILYLRRLESRTFLANGSKTTRMMLFPEVFRVRDKNGFKFGSLTLVSQPLSLQVKYRVYVSFYWQVK